MRHEVRFRDFYARYYVIPLNRGRNRWICSHLVVHHTRNSTIGITFRSKFFFIDNYEGFFTTDQTHVMCAKRRLKDSI